MSNFNINLHFIGVIEAMRRYLKYLAAVDDWETYRIKIL